MRKKRLMVPLLVCELLLVSSGHTYAANQYVQKNNGLVPGLYQWKTGQRTKALAVALLEGGAIAGSSYFALNSDADRWRKRYYRVEDAEEAGRVYTKYKDAKNNRKTARRLLWAAGGVYLANLLDVVLYKQDMGTVVALSGSNKTTLHFVVRF